MINYFRYGYPEPKAGHPLSLQVETTARGIAWLAAAGPDTWQPAGEPATFAPHPHHALQQRYRLFLDAIRQTT